MPFQTTNWTLIVQAADRDAAAARVALEDLCDASQRRSGEGADRFDQLTARLTDEEPST